MPENEPLKRLFEQCIDRHADSLYRVAFRLTGNQDTAGELVQETYLQAWRSLSSIRDQSKLRSWVFGILRNQYLKLVRKNKTTPLPASDLVESTAQQTESDNSTRSKNEIADAVQLAVSKLEDIHRLPVLLVSMGQMSVDEAANVLELPRGTVLSRLHRGRQKLKEILSREFSQFEH